MAATSDQWSVQDVWAVEVWSYWCGLFIYWCGLWSYWCGLLGQWCGLAMGWYIRSAWCDQLTGPLCPVPPGVIS